MTIRRYVVPTAGAAVVLIAAGISPGITAHAGARAARPAAAGASMAYGSIVVAVGGDSVEVFAPGAHGNVAPIRTIKGAAAKFDNMDSLDLDSAGNIWTANFNGGLIQKFSGTATGNVAPTNSISENNNNDELPFGVAVSNDDKKVWIGNDGSSILSAYSTSASGITAAAQRITGAETGIGFTRDVTFSTNGKQLYQSDGGNGVIHEYSVNGAEDQAPIRTITVGGSSTNQVQGIAVDGAGNVWVADNKTNSLYEFGKSDTTPIRTITGSSTGLDDPAGVTIDAVGNVWVAVEGNLATSKPAAVEAFKPTANGNVAPITRIAGATTGLSDFASDVVVYGGSPGKPTGVKVTGGKSGFHLTWKAPSNAGGGLIGYVIERKVSKHAKWKVIGTKRKPHYTDAFGAARPKPGHKYRYATIAYNEFGASGRSKPATGKAK